MKTKAVKPDEPMTQTPSTTAAWRARIGELERETIDAEQALAATRAERRTAAGSALVFGTNPEAAAALEATEREAERKLDSLKCAVELARAELKALEDTERQARLDAQRARRLAVANEIQREAAAVDGLFDQAAERLRIIESLLTQYQLEGGAFARSLKSCSTRAALAAGLRQYLETGFVGGSEHIRPLAEQLGALAAMRGAEDWPAANPPVA